MSYWTFTDIFEEAGPRVTPFHGGFGLLNYQDLSGPGSKLFATGQLPENIRGRFFKFRISFTDVTSVYGLQIATSIIREWGSL